MKRMQAMWEEIYDHVKCLYCETDSLVPVRSDICIKCGTDGSLIWVNRDKEEAFATEFSPEEASALLQGDHWDAAEINSAR